MSSVGFSFIQQFLDDHGRVAFRAARQVFSGQIDNFGEAAFGADHLHRFFAATIHKGSPEKFWTGDALKMAEQAAYTMGKDGGQVLKVKVFVAKDPIH
ncbi:hypothetical protein MJO47_01055 [Desulfuromonas sp. KJ2020]|uniref:hypothetical protein n=1 Tax=Desulfuromonas sp. KJ2020 TaxID=2919173 RepID=UPI0020A7FAAD|nr:hypothetical protein [Desulfuromonas sp. KJ2020]MCP3175681.1 hypothetical protein [Desulfuromonas sp. KJ2020]